MLILVIEEKSFNTKLGLNKSSGAGKTFPEFLGRAIFFLLKQPVEIRDIIKAATVRYFRN